MFVLAFCFYFFYFIFFFNKINKISWVPCFYTTFNFVVGVPLVLCIGDNACFCCGGRCTLVERHYALVICSVGQIFQNMLF